MFPTYVGMNRHHLRHTRIIRDVPHVCGDEPASGKAYWDHMNRSVAYVGDAADGSDTKIIVRVDYTKGGLKANFIVTIDRVPKGAMRLPQYMEIER